MIDVDYRDGHTTSLPHAVRYVHENGFLEFVTTNGELVCAIARDEVRAVHVRQPDHPSLNHQDSGLAPVPPLPVTTTLT